MKRTNGDFEKRVSQGAKKIVKVCLKLASGHELLVLVDETTREIGQILARAATSYKVRPTILEVPVFQQKKIHSSSTLPMPVEAAIKGSHALTTCLMDDSDCLDFRVKIIEVSQGSGIKVAHLPGVTQGILATAVNLDYNDIVSQCERLARALALGRKAELITEDDRGAKYSLEMYLGGWDRTPVMSTGIIPDGAWGNIPGGETYIAPVEGKARGEVFVNGSVRGFVIPHGEGMRLTFTKGRLVDDFSRRSMITKVILEEKRVAEAQGDDNWNNLAELGIGVNPKVEELTGIEIQDEKKYGTAHIAIGRNVQHGGKVESSIHSDIILRRPEIRIDGKVILKDGEIVPGLSDWEEDLRLVTYEKEWPNSFSSVSRTGILAVVKKKMLFVEWFCGAGRRNYMRIGNQETARVCATIYGKTPPETDITRVELATKAKIEDDKILRALRVLEKYQLIRVS